VWKKFRVYENFFEDFCHCVSKTFTIVLTLYSNKYPVIYTFFKRTKFAVACRNLIGYF